MITNIIFSKDRPLQLDALLNSLETFSGTIFNNIVIHTYTDKSFKLGYNIVNELHPDTSFVLEKNLKDDILSNMTSEFTSFMVDDQIMFKAIPKIDLNTLRSLQDTCFSLRLGKNIKEPHISYPLSVDGHVYLTEDIKPLIESIGFDNPNKLESKLQRYKHDWNILWKHQCMVSIPHNRVSSKSHCAFSGLYTTEVLNDYLVRGYEINISKMDFSGLDNVHAVIDYKFKLR